jgi:hypothetical protein
MVSGRSGSYEDGSYDDEKFFKVSSDWRYRFPHWQAEEQRFLRRPEFVRLDRASEPTEFVQRLLETVESHFPQRSRYRQAVP